MKKLLEPVLRKLQDLGLQTKLTLLTIILTVLPLILLAVMTFSSSQTVLESQAQRHIAALMEEKARFIQTVMAEVESLIANVSGQDALKAVLSRPLGTMSDFDRLSTQARIGYILSGYINLKGLVSIDVFGPGGVAFHVGDTLDVEQPRQDLIDELQERSRQSPSTVFWSGIGDNINGSSTFKKVVTAVKRISGRTSPDGKDPLVVVSYNPAILNQGNVPGRPDFTLIIDSRNRIICHPEPSQWGQSASEVLIRHVELGNHSFNFNHGGRDYDVHITDLSRGGWHMLYFSGRDDLVSATTALAAGTLLAVTLALVMLFFLSRLISHSVVLPITRITQGFKSLQDDETRLPGHLQATSHDEIGTLIGWYNAFLDGYRIQKQTSEELRLRQEELKELNHTLEARIEAELQSSREKDTMLVHQSRQATMGEMIGNIAHQWRQPLNTAALLVQDLTMSWKFGEIDDAAIESFGTQMMGVIERMSTTIDDFRDFFKPNKDRVVFDVEAAVRTTISFVDSAFKNNSIDIEVVLNRPGTVLGYPNEFSQVMLNIMNNARDILNEKNPEVKLVRVTIGTEDGRQVVRIADSGGGVPEAIMDKIFDPYFTTKEPGKGTGIGLFMSKTIIERNMGGRLSVSNVKLAEGMTGAEFRIEL